MYKIFIDGSAGTTGLRIRERLAARHDLTVLEIAPELHRDTAERSRLLNEADVAFLCLPDAAAREAVSLVTNPNVRVIDTSTAHRTSESWAYGYPELSEEHRQAIISGYRIAVPGCHAGGFVSLIYPLVKSNILPRGALLSCFSITGYSGGGKAMIAEYEAPEPDAAFSSPRPYALSQQHKHLKEMTLIPGLLHEPIFSPIVANYYSGMLVTVPVFPEQLQTPLTPEELTDFYQKYYGDQPLMRVLPFQDAPSALSAGSLSGIDYAEIRVFGNRERMLLTARFDNLGKGASGAAIQCMNLALGLPETDGLCQ